VNFKEMADMMKLAGEAKNLQKEQERVQRQQIELLEKISITLEKILEELRKNPD
jgi:hypothetical protein